MSALAAEHLGMPVVVPQGDEHMSITVARAVVQASLRGGAVWVHVECARVPVVVGDSVGDVVERWHARAGSLTSRGERDA